MSRKEEDSKSQNTSSLAASLASLDTMSGAQRSRTEGQSDQLPLSVVETSSHSFPRSSPLNVQSYGQQNYPGRSTNQSGPISPHEFSFPQQQAANPTPPLPGGSSAASPFMGFAPGFPVTQQYPSGVITPMPYSASNPYPSGYISPGRQSPPQYSPSTPYPPGYTVPSYNHRANMAGTLGQMTPVSIQPGPMPSTSYSQGFGGTQSVQQIPQRKPSDDSDDDCFNLFWLFFLLGPLTWPCALFGICSDRRSERMAGFVSLIALTLVLVAAAVILSQASKETDDS